MIDAVAQVRFSWDSHQAKCRATAYDVKGGLLAEVIIDLPAETRQRIWSTRGHGVALLRIEEAAEKYLRTMLELRY